MKSEETKYKYSDSPSRSHALIAMFFVYFEVELKKSIKLSVTVPTFIVSFMHTL